jgi:hypothetical protein
MVPIIIAVLANSSIYGTSSLQILSRSFGLEIGYALCIAIVASKLVSYHAAMLSLLCGARLSILLGCTLHLYGWSLLAGKWLHFGFFVVGAGNGCIAEALISEVHDRSRACSSLEMRLLYMVLVSVSKIPALFNHWINQLRLSVLEPDFVSWEVMCCILAIPPFVAGMIAFFRCSRNPVGTKKHATFFVCETARPQVDDQFVWFCTVFHAVADLRFAVYMVSISQTALGMFLGKPAQAEEFAEVVWKMVAVGWVICMPVCFLLLDLLGPILFVTITIIVCFIWSQMVESESFPNAAFSLLFLQFIRPILHLMLMAVAEGFTGNCQMCERRYSCMQSISGSIQGVLLLSMRWCRPKTFTFILNSGIVAGMLLMIMRLAVNVDTSSSSDRMSIDAAAETTPAPPPIIDPPSDKVKCPDDTTLVQPHSHPRVPTTHTPS